MLIPIQKVMGLLHGPKTVQSDASLLHDSLLCGSLLLSADIEREEDRAERFSALFKLENLDIEFEGVKALLRYNSHRKGKFS
jgi:hypothetical protein